jgi:hypothetical protein
MLLPNAKNIGWIKDEVAKRCDVKDKVKIILKKVSGPVFKNDLQGVYGYVEDRVYNQHLKAIESLIQV